MLTSRTACRRASRLGLIICCLTGGTAAQGAPVVGKLCKLQQPDGSSVEARIWGDEFYGVTESLDGYTLVRDPHSGFLCYAELSPDEDRLVSTNAPAGQSRQLNRSISQHVRVSARSAAAQARAARERFQREGLAILPGQRQLRAPTTGSVQGICLIIDFADDAGAISPATVANYCNQVGFTGFGNNGSVRDYFFDVSQGGLTYTNYVPSVYYRAAHNKTYYTDPLVDYGTRARELIVEALTALDNQDFDFSQYDANADGVIDAVNCFYAGYCPNDWAEGLWPHAWTVFFSADGVSTQNYQITDMGNNLALSTFCHENGHMLLDWPDLYDYGYDSTGVGRFCIMCYGTSATNPCEPCAYLKYVAGWSNAIPLTSPQAGLSLPAAGTNTCYKFSHPLYPHEYYLIENRQKTGRDSGLPGAGLALWHIDTRGDNCNQQMTASAHYLVTLVQADGSWDLEHNRDYGDATDLFAAPTYGQCSPTTAPNTKWWDGSASGLVVADISTSASTMTFRYDSLADCNANGIPDPQDISQGRSADCTGNGIPDECDLTRGLVNDCNGNAVPDECEMSAASGDCNANGLLDACENETRNGLVAEYFDNADLTGTRRSHLDPAISFNWNAGAPWTDFGSDTFSVRWSGRVRTPAISGNYRFYTYTNDGVRLWVNNQLLVDKWIVQTAAEWSGLISLQANSEYPIVMEYFDNADSAVAELRWMPPGRPKSLVPVSQLIPGRDCNGNGRPDTCDAPAGGDFNLDGDVNLTDYPGFADCQSAPGLPPNPATAPCRPLCRQAFDLDADGDVDLGDFAGFQQNSTG